LTIGLLLAIAAVALALGGFDEQWLPAFVLSVGAFVLSAAPLLRGSG
jgi:hypothetical protein